jgi:uncharacterized membrane protein YdbT with pleckstrin-like domain
MKVVNKRPNYIKSSDRVRSINQAYTVVFRAINKIEVDINTAGNIIKKTNK